MERGYLILANSCEDVVFGGFSAGGTLALLAASSHLHSVKAVFAINPAMRLRTMTARLAPAVILWNKLVDHVSKEESRWHFVPNEPENVDINYLRNPISGVKELLELINEVSRSLERIKIPTLLIQGSNDPVVHPDGSKEAYRMLGSRDKELIILNSQRHVIVRGEGSPRVFARVLGFLQSRL